jgi:hypothetical protein
MTERVFSERTSVVPFESPPCSALTQDFFINVQVWTILWATPGQYFEVKEQGHKKGAEITSPFNCFIDSIVLS